jgi:hypothetical protein
MTVSITPIWRDQALEEEFNQRQMMGQPCGDLVRLMVKVIFARQTGLRGPIRPPGRLFVSSPGRDGWHHHSADRCRCARIWALDLRAAMRSGSSTTFLQVAAYAEGRPAARGSAAAIPGLHRRARY